MNIHQAMQAEYRVRHEQKIERRRRGLKIGSQFIAESTGSNVAYCSTCNAPVVDSEEGRRAHRERMPECGRKP